MAVIDTFDNISINGVDIDRSGDNYADELLNAKSFVNDVNGDMLAIEDGDGGRLLTFESNGYIETKQFDTSSLMDTSRYTTMDFAVSDESGNVIFAIIDGEMTTNTEGSLFGKTFSVLGDSISTYSGYIPEGYAAYYPSGDVNDVSKTWWGQLISETGMVHWNQAAWSGSRCCGDSTDDESGEAGCSDKRIADVGAGHSVAPDFIIVYIGTNDYGLGTPKTLGDFSSTDELVAEGNVQVFASAYSLMISKLRTSYPLSRIVCCTLTEWRFVDPDSTYPILNSKGNSATQFNEQIRAIADAFGCSVCDLHSCGMNHWNTATYTVDNSGKGLHPNTAGMTLIKNAVKSTLLGLV